MISFSGLGCGSVRWRGPVAGAAGARWSGKGLFPVRVTLRQRRISTALRHRAGKMQQGRKTRQPAARARLDKRRGDPSRNILGFVRQIDHKRKAGISKHARHIHAATALVGQRVDQRAMQRHQAVGEFRGQQTARQLHVRGENTKHHIKFVMIHM